MRKMIMVVGILSLMAGLAIAKGPLEKEVEAAKSRADIVHTELGDLCSDEAWANVIAADGFDYEGEITATTEADWYEVFVTVTGTYHFETSAGTDPTMTDTRLYLYEGDCDLDDLTQLAYNDDIDYPANAFSGFDVDLDAGTSYYVKVIAYPYTSDFGSYTLAMTGGTPPPPPPANDLCAGAIALPSGAFQITGDTTDANDDYAPGTWGDSCTGYGAAGPDVVYVVDLVEGESLNVAMESDPYFDMSLYLITDCADPYASCVAGSDQGTVEAIYFTAPADGTYYLIADGYGSSNSGPFTLTGIAAVSNENTTFGNLKASFR